MRYILFFFLICSFVTSDFGQNKSDTISKIKSISDTSRTTDTHTSVDSINIKQIVEGQIRAIKEKQLWKTKKQIIVTALKNETTQPEIKKGLNNIWSNFVQNTLAPFFAKIQNVIFYSEGISNQLSILGIASLITFLIVIIRRKIINKKPLRKNGLKDSIRLLREERVGNKVDINLKGIRNRLVNNTLTYRNTKAGITKVAKEMNISKGEVLLAAKIKSYELDNNWLGRINKKMYWRIF